MTLLEQRIQLSLDLASGVCEFLSHVPAGIAIQMEGSHSPAYLSDTTTHNSDGGSTAMVKVLPSVDTTRRPLSLTATCS